jgi:hypothetical protein
MGDATILVHGVVEVRDTSTGRWLTSSMTSPFRSPACSLNSNTADGKQVAGVVAYPPWTNLRQPRIAYHVQEPRPSSTKFTQERKPASLT